MTTKTKRAAALPMANVLPARIWRGGQSWNLQSVWRIGPTVARVTIERDAYDNQSRLVVEAFDRGGVRWNVIVSVPMTKERATFGLSYASREEPRAELVTEEGALLDEANAILAAAL
jgi:hypothetical protein